MDDTNLHRLVAAVLSKQDAQHAISLLECDANLVEFAPLVPRAVVAMALNICLFSDLLQRVPSARAYASLQRARGRRIVFDHGALRTVEGSDAMKTGYAEFKAILEPLGYREAGVYPLDALRMTGRALVHADFPESIPQFFVSELHVDRFSEKFQIAAHAVFDQSEAPVDAPGRDLLRALADADETDFAVAAAGLGSVVRAFRRRHGAADMENYRILLDESAEAAWIATEGNAFNHAADRVADLESLADELRVLGFNLKDDIERSRSGRVRQTALKADVVTRDLRTTQSAVPLAVPGSFFEFISRQPSHMAKLDLNFDSANAQGIFKMTGVAIAEAAQR